VRVTAFEIIDDQRRFLCVVHKQLACQTGDFYPHVNPFLFWNVDCIVKTVAVVQLPGRRAVKCWRVLNGIFQSAFMRSKIDQFIRISVCHPKHDAHEFATIRRGEIDFDHAVFEIYVLQIRDTGFQKDALSTQVILNLAVRILHHPSIGIEIYGGEIRRRCNRTPRADSREQNRQNKKTNKNKSHT